MKKQSQVATNTLGRQFSDAKWYRWPGMAAGAGVGALGGFMFNRQRNQSNRPSTMLSDINRGLRLGASVAHTLGDGGKTLSAKTKPTIANTVKTVTSIAPTLGRVRYNPLLGQVTK